MDCPKCQSAGINQAGICLVCGFQALPSIDGTGQPDAAAPSPESAQATATDNAPALEEHQLEENQTELPEWRVELSRRLQEIRLRRETEGDIRLPETPRADAEDAASRAAEADTPPAGIEETPKPRKPRRTPRVVPFEPAVLAKSPEPESTPPEPVPPESPPAAPQVADLPIRHANVPAQGSRTDGLERLADTFQKGRQTGADHAALMTDIRASAPAPAPAVTVQEPGVDRLILLSRTLSGLVDLILVLFFAGSIVFAVDVLEGIEVFDRTSMTHYGLLFLVTFFVYSLFFLGSGRQTIGMMLTDLQVVGAADPRPKAAQLIVRCVAYLLSFALAGIGFFWSIFDRRARCLHDIFSHTLVRRIPL